MLEEGDTIPPLEALDDSGKMRNLQELSPSWLVLWAYPKDDTPG